MAKIKVPENKQKKVVNSDTKVVKALSEINKTTSKTNDVLNTLLETIVQERIERNKRLQKSAATRKKKADSTNSTTNNKTTSSVNDIKQTTKVTSSAKTTSSVKKSKRLSPTLIDSLSSIPDPANLSGLGSAYAVTALTGGLINPALAQSLGLNKALSKSLKSGVNTIYQGAMGLLSGLFSKSEEEPKKETITNSVIKKDPNAKLIRKIDGLFGQLFKKLDKDEKKKEDKKSSLLGLLTAGIGAMLLSGLLKGFGLDPVKIITDIQNIIKEGGSKLIQWLFGADKGTARTISDLMIPAMEGLWIAKKLGFSPLYGMGAALLLDSFLPWRDEQAKQIDEIRRGKDNVELVNPWKKLVLQRAISGFMIGLKLGGIPGALAGATLMGIVGFAEGLWNGDFEAYEHAKRLDRVGDTADKKGLDRAQVIQTFDRKYEVAKETKKLDHLSDEQLEEYLLNETLAEIDPSKNKSEYRINNAKIRDQVKNHKTLGLFSTGEKHDKQTDWTGDYRNKYEKAYIAYTEKAKADKIEPMAFKDWYAQDQKQRGLTKLSELIPQTSKNNLSTPLMSTYSDASPLMSTYVSIPKEESRIKNEHSVIEIQNQTENKLASKSISQTLDDIRNGIIKKNTEPQKVIVENIKDIKNGNTVVNMGNSTSQSSNMTNGTVGATL